MRRFVSCTAALLGSLAALLAQGSVAPDPYTDQLPGRDNAQWQEFVRLHPGSWTSWWNHATGTPKAIFGPGLDIADWRGDSLAEARRHAQALLREQRLLLGLGDSEFREAIAAPMGNVWTFTFDQYFAGVPVIGGRADVRVNRCGRIAFFGSVAWPIPKGFGTVPAIDEANATRLAWQALAVDPPANPQPGKPRPPRLVIWGDVDAAQKAPFFLAWEVAVSAIAADGSGPAGRWYIDARTGAALHYTNDKHECGFGGDPGRAPPVENTAGHALPPATYTVMAWARDGVSCVTPATNVPLPGLQISVPGVGTVVTDANGQFTASLTQSASVTVNMRGVHNLLIQGSNAVTRTATLQPGVPRTLQLLTSGAADTSLAHTTCELWVWRVNEFARSILGNSPQLLAADSIVPTVNIASTCNAFYGGNSINFYAAGGGCSNTASSSVVAHEWGHGLDDQYGGISQNQGLSEAWGDTVSEYLLDDPIIGDGFNGVLGAGIRTGTNGTQYPPPAEVHAAGEVFMGFNWLFRQNLRTAFGTQQATAISNSVVIGSIAANATDQPSAVLQIFIADDNDGNLGNGVPHYAQLEPAALAHNLPYPVITVGTVSAAPLLGTADQLVPRLVLATAVPNSGSYTSVSLVYNDGAAHTRPMIPTGNPNEYQAQLPGEAAPAAVTWHVEAMHSSNLLQRSPAFVDYSYSVQAETRLYFEDFEHGAPGWTHGADAGVDEWEIATPAGLGTATWLDPPTAAGGTKCAGLDLTGDGDYENNSDTWLRSPPINCSGYTNVRLRFKRWLTVDAGTFDQATMRCSGAPFWGNPTTFPLFDSSWVTFDTILPFASNNPAAVLEFRLRADGSTTFGGWNIDDVEVYVTSAPVPLPVTLQMLPDQAVQGTPMTLTVHTQGSQPFLLVLGSTSGPTLIPGVPDLLVGGGLTTLPGNTNAAGAFTTPFFAPNPVPLTGASWYGQVLTLDPSLQIVTSNQFHNLFTR
jgi:hypothetical protein